MRTSLSAALACLLAPALVLGPSTPIQAGPGHAHEHGVTHLDIVIDGGQVAIELQGAGDHLVGFEHAPEDGDQHRAWARTRARLADGDSLFAFAPAAGCTLERAQVHEPEADAGGETGHHHADHGTAHGHGHAGHGHGGADHRHGASGEGHGPANGHDHDRHHHDHGHGHGHDHGDHGSHGASRDWRAQYAFTCRDTGRLGHIQVGLFDVFPDHREVRFQLLSGIHQDGGRLVPARTRIDLP